MKSQRLKKYTALYCISFLAALTVACDVGLHDSSPNSLTPIEIWQDLGLGLTQSPCGPEPSDQVDFFFISVSRPAEYAQGSHRDTGSQSPM